MAFKLDSVVPWGRSFEEYVAMFSLRETDLRKRILGVADGPAAFNAELTARGGEIVSFDPIFAATEEEIDARVKLVAPEIFAKVKANADDFVWDVIRSPDHLLEIRLGAMRRFLADFARGVEKGRYIDASLPRLPFEDDAFDLGLCSHFLFLYGERLDLDFHVRSILELSRVSAEIRIFPVLELGNAPSRHLGEVTRILENMHHLKVTLVDVSYEFQRGARQMLRIQRDV